MPALEYKKVNEITVEDLVDYLHLDSTQIDNNQRSLLTTMKAAAINYIAGVTGLAPEALDTLPDMTIAFFALVQNMFDNRTYYVDKANIDDTVSSILNMYRTNLL